MGYFRASKWRSCKFCQKLFNRQPNLRSKRLGTFFRKLRSSKSKRNSCLIVDSNQKLAKMRKKTNKNKSKLFSLKKTAKASPTQILLKILQRIRNRPLKNKKTAILMKLRTDLSKKFWGLCKNIMKKLLTKNLN